MENYGAGGNLTTCLLDFKFWPFLYCFQFKDSQQRFSLLPKYGHENKLVEMVLTRLSISVAHSLDPFISMKLHE